MRENRSYGSEGGEGQPFPTPIQHWLADVGVCPYSTVGLRAVALTQPTTHAGMNFSATPLMQ
jgi:hypothetical protein